MDFLIGLGLALASLIMVLQVTLILLWIERKGSALIQDRVGANRANLFGGILPFNLGIVNTLLADPVKLFFKEDVIPRGADHFLHWLAPFLSLFPLLLVYATVPFGDVLVVGERVINLQAIDYGLGLLIVLALASLSVYGVVLAGWASNSRWALLGGVRGSAQMISYEIGMGLALVGVVLTYGSLDLQAIARAQGDLLFGFIPAWGVLFQPLGLVIFFIAGMAESKRAPFDLPEAESELVAGFFTEYSGSKQSVFMMADFVEVAIVAALVTTLYFGGWQVPYLHRDGFHFPGGAHLWVPSLIVTVLQLVAFITKLFLFCWVQILIRWTMPRMRYDQLMNLGWKVLLPLGLLNLAVTAVVMLALGPKP